MKKVSIILLFFTLTNLIITAQQKDTINTKWRWNQNIVDLFKIKFSDILIKPLIINDVIFFNGSLYPYNIARGKILKYKDPISLKFIKDNCNDSVVLFNEESYLFIVDIYNGKVLLEIKRDLGMKYPFITKPKVLKKDYCYFLKNDTTFTCYDYIKKIEKWNFYITKKRPDRIYSEALEVDDNVIIATEHKILFLSSLNGKVLLELSINSSISGNMILDNNILFYMTDKDGCVHAYDIKHRKELWKFSDEGKYGGGGMGSNITIEGDTLFYASGSLVALNKNTGEIFWWNKDVAVHFLYSTQCIITNKYIITREDQYDEFPIVCFNKINGKKVAFSFSNAFMGESNVYSKKHRIFIKISRQEGVSMKLDANEIVND